MRELGAALPLTGGAILFKPFTSLRSPRSAALYDPSSVTNNAPSHWTFCCRAVHLHSPVTAPAAGPDLDRLWLAQQRGSALRHARAVTSHVTA